MSANDYQRGGDHYRKNEYQHWDFVTDLALHYLIGNATKYMSRWRDKGGLVDLEKSLHYLNKAIERNAAPAHVSWRSVNPALFNERVERFTAQLPEEEAEAVTFAVNGEYPAAISVVGRIIAAATPSS